MKVPCFLVLLLSGVVSAQAPGVRTALGDVNDPTGPARGWVLASDPESTADLRPLVEGHGPGVRITSPAGVTLIRPEWSLTGTFTVSALFQRTPRSSASAAYGLIVGATRTSSGLAFLVRPDGMCSIRNAGDVSSSGTWTPITSLRSGTADGPPIDRLEVRVGASDAVFVVNGQPLGVVPIAVSGLDGSAGVHVGANGEVLAAAFAVTTAPSPR